MLYMLSYKPSTSLQNRDIFTFSKTLPSIKNRKETPVQFRIWYIHKFYVEKW